MDQTVIMKLQVNVEGNGPSSAPMGAPQAAHAGIFQPSSKKKTPSTGVASSAAHVGGCGQWGSMGISLYV